ncbi:MAG: diacylglycerol kinase [Firmicutes bacterium]|nr:diacylglycerol kinase [Bacillota bacterium]
MKMNEQKETNLLKNMLNKCKYTLQGLSYCFKNESSFLFVAMIACLVIILGILFDIAFLEWVISFGSLAFILIIELINTAIEATVDMVTQEYNEYAKIAKDCGSAATGIMSVLATIVNLIIFIPYFIELFIGLF